MVNEEQKVLVLGSGKFGYHSDFEQRVNVDANPFPTVDVVTDLNQFQWVFKDNTFDRVEADSILEHLHDKIRPLEEIWRVTKHGGTVEIRVPYQERAWDHIDHKHTYTYTTFKSLCENNFGSAYMCKNKSVQFEELWHKNIPTSIGKFIPNWRLPGRTLTIREVASLFFGFIVKEIIFQLKIIKKEERTRKEGR